METEPISDRRMRSSAEVFDEHNIADALISLRIQNPAAIRRNSQAGWPLERVSLERPKLCNSVGNKVEELERRASRCHGRDEKDAVVQHRPITPISGIE